jgi:hypothetical protein
MEIGVGTAEVFPLKNYMKFVDGYKGDMLVKVGISQYPEEIVAGRLFRAEKDI